MFFAKLIGWFSNYMFMFDTPLHIAGSILAILGACLSITMHIFTIRKKILFTKLARDLVGIAQYACMFAWTGMALTIVGAFREIIFILKEKYKFAQHIAWLFVFFFLSAVVAPLLSWQGYISIIPSVGSVLLILGLYSKKTHVIKLFYLGGTILWFIYDVIDKNYMQAIFIAIEIIFLIISLIILLVKHIKNRNIQKMA
jgi:hypothetical protein